MRINYRWRLDFTMTTNTNHIVVVHGYIRTRFRFVAWILFRKRYNRKKFHLISITKAEDNYDKRK